MIDQTLHIKTVQDHKKEVAIVTLNFYSPQPKHPLELSNLGYQTNIHTISF